MPPENPPAPENKPAPTPPAPDAAAAELAALREENARLKAAAPPPPEKDLGDKARDAKDKADSEAARERALQRAIEFNMKSADFIKTHGSMLPKEVPEIFAQAEKENYSSAIEKDAAIKSGVIQSFFKVQANVDLLTPTQKERLDEYLALTKNGKQDKAQEVYGMIFEPALEKMKSVRKAEALRNGYNGSDSAKAHEQKMINLSKKHYGLEK